MSGDRRLKLLYAGFGWGMGTWIPFAALALRARGFDPVQIGLLLGSNSLGTLVASPLWSTVADRRIGSSRALRLALIGGAAAAVGLSLSGRNFPLTAGLFALFGATVGAATGLQDSLALGYLGEARASRYGAFRLFGSGGWAVTVVALGVLLQYTSLALVFPLCAVGLMAWAAVRGPILLLSPVRQKEGESRFGSAMDALIHAPRLRLFLLGLFVMSAGTYAAWNFLPLRIVGTGGGPFLAGLGPGVAAVVEIPLMLVTGRVIFRIGLRGCFVLGTAVYTIQLLVFAAVANPVVIACVLIARGAGYAFAFVATVRITGEITPRHLRNAGQLLNGMVMLGIAPLAGSVAGGIVYATLGAPSLFLLSALLVVLGTGIVAMAVPGSRVLRQRQRVAVGVPEPGDPPAHSL